MDVGHDGMGKQIDIARARGICPTGTHKVGGAFVLTDCHRQHRLVIAVGIVRRDNGNRHVFVFATDGINHMPACQTCPNHHHALLVRLLATHNDFLIDLFYGSQLCGCQRTTWQHDWRYCSSYRLPAHLSSSTGKRLINARASP